MNWLRDRARVIELAAAGWLTLMLSGIHFIVLTKAGALWRDEISSLHLANMPTLRSFWSYLVYDPCPAFYFLLLRAWSALGLAGSDFNLRILGVVIGLGVIAALWWSCWRINRAAPLWPLALFALNPITFQFGDSLRAYGVALIWIILCFTAIWEITFRPVRLRRILFAIAAAVLTVQSLITASLVLFAICVASLTISARRKRWESFAVVLGTGAIAAASLLIYIPIFLRTHEWSLICVDTTNYLTILLSYANALAIGNMAALYFWAGLIGLGLILAFVAQFPLKRFHFLQDRQDEFLFGAIALLIATAAMLTFFRNVGWFTSAWYFLPLMCVSILCLHAILTPVVKIEWRLLSATAAAGLSLLFVPATTHYAVMSRTNADVVAATVAQKATKDDLIVVSPYFYAVSFHRYYNGVAPWTTLPAVDDYSLHRWDLLKRAMQTPGAINQTLDRVRATLDSGHIVFLVGAFPPNASKKPAALPPAPNAIAGWSFQAYVRNWGQQTSYLVHQHASRATFYLMKENAPINPLEHLGIIAVHGRVPSITAAN